MNDSPMNPRVPPPPSAIRCRGLGKRFGHVTAVEGVDIDVPEGRFLALLGPSGCGKTTALRLIAGFERPDVGTIEIGNRMVAGPNLQTPTETRRVGMVFQEYALFPHLTVAQNVAFGLRDAPHPAARVHDVLRMVALESVRDRLPHALSGGQQQRVALARALAPHPQVILLDEPFSNLDAVLRRRVRTEVRHILRQAGVTAIFVTHDQEEAFSLADEVAVMIDGRMIQVGTPERLYRRPETREVATFLGDANFLPGDAQGAEVTCEVGRLSLHQTTHGPVAVMLRPEDLIITAAADGTGEIVEREYFGHDQMLTVRLSTGTALKCRQTGCCRGFREGQRIHLTVDTPVMAYPRP